MKRFATAVLALVVALSFSIEAQAQHPYANSGPEWWAKVELQLAHSLQSELPQVREQQLKNIIILATYYRDKLDLESAVVPLISIYKRDKVMQHREMALACLQSIGGVRASEFLASRVSPEESDAGRASIRAVLQEYAEGSVEPVALQP